MSVSLMDGRLTLTTADLLLLALVGSFAVATLAGPSTIAFLHRLKFGQTINTDAPGTHAAKSGTPTMGGILFVYGVAFAALIAVTLSFVAPGSDVFRGTNMIRDVAVVTMVFAAHVGIGFADDYLSIKRGKNLGLKARYKLLWQFVVAVLFAGFIYLSGPDSPVQVRLFHGDMWIARPLYCAAIVLAMMGMSNCTNLTDGLDGLLGGLAVMALLGLSAIIWRDSFGSAFFGWALAGACLGFLVYNGHPARVFMGDTGSLAIGAALTAMAVLGHAELILLVLSVVFLAEGFSVAIQVISFKTTGKRVFRMAPLHHHFELAGWKEMQVVTRFWIAGLLAMLVAIAFATPD